MLLYGKKAAAKAPKRRSRAGCMHCKEKKKKCDEVRPQCDRCAERNLECEYEAVKPRKRRRPSTLQSPRLSNPQWDGQEWSHRFKTEDAPDDSYFDPTCARKWDTTPAYTYAVSDGYVDRPAEAQWPTEDDDDIQEIVRSHSISESVTSSYSTASRSSYMDLATIAPSPVASPLFEFSAPAFQEFSDQRNRRALVDHFCNVMSHLMVFKEDTGNPFRQLVLPLSHASSPVMNAIFALSCAHLEYRDVENEEKSLDFHNRALQGVAELVAKNDPSRREEVLGAIMLLVYYEVLVQRGNSNIVQGHLRGALTIMETQPAAPTPTSLFLERAFRFYDVISALSWGTSPISTAPLNLSPLTLPDNTFSNTLSVSSLSEVDTLLGAATDLWPIIHRLSNLLEVQIDLKLAVQSGDILRAETLQSELEISSNSIELALFQWTPIKQTKVFEVLSSTSEGLDTICDPTISALPSSDDLFQDQDPRMQSILNNAEAYRQAAFLYLYRYVRELPRRDEQVQIHTTRTLEACVRVCEWQGPMSALLWPLFLSACEAVDVTQRTLARTAFDACQRRQGMTNITRAWEVVELVWGFDDAGEEASWRDICREKEYNIVFG